MRHGDVILTLCLRICGLQVSDCLTSSDTKMLQRITEVHADLYLCCSVLTNDVCIIVLLSRSKPFRPGFDASRHRLELMKLTKTYVLIVKSQIPYGPWSCCSAGYWRRGNIYKSTERCTWMKDST